MLFEKDFGPEKKLDLEAKVNGLSWMEKKHYRDDDLIDLGLPENAAVYLHRTLSCKEAVSLYVSLGSNDAIKCWLNGELLLENNVNRSVAAGQETAALHLKKGVNSFLMKIVNGTNASGFYFNMFRAFGLRGLTASFLHRPIHGFIPSISRMVQMGPFISVITTARSLKIIRPYPGIFSSNTVSRTESIMVGYGD